MDDQPSSFYDSLAESHHYIFKDWNSSIEWQAGVFGALIERPESGKSLHILDCACGIGTQALGLARRGHRVVATDLCAKAVDRARREAAQRGLAITFEVADMQDLQTIPESGFDIVLAADNALPHLDEEGLRQAARSIAAKLNPGGRFIASIRDYDQLLLERPAIQAPAFHREGGRRRIVHQVWDWIDDRRYTFHLYITLETDTGWECKHYVSSYRAVRREELTGILKDSGFGNIHWAMPSESGFYQPIVIAEK